MLQYRWKPLDMPETCEETHINPYDYIYAKYEFGRLDVKNLYKKFPNCTVFRGVDRLKLMYSMLVTKQSEGGCDLDIYRLIKDKVREGGRRRERGEESSCITPIRQHTPLFPD